MFLAMNRFKVKLGSEADFETVWRERDSHLRTVPGFKSFHLLRGPTKDDHTLYASHSEWASRADFEAWTRSEAFRKAHGSAGANKPLYLGHPEVELFESRWKTRRPESRVGDADERELGMAGPRPAQLTDRAACRNASRS
jgi:heme-degrading monooxygenase HmoA